MPDFAQLTLAANSALFALAALAVWFAGSRISHYANTISRKTGMGQALVGIVLLGGVAMQAAILALVDFVTGRRALTSVVPDPGVLLQGMLNILLLALVGAGIVIGDTGFLGIGLWIWACLAAYVLSVWVLSRDAGRQSWLAARHGHVDEELLRRKHKEDAGATERTLRAAVVRTAIAAVVVLVAGFLVARTGSTIAEQTGIGSSFTGFVLVAISTSLPELSTALSAARLGLFTMAISDILGTNLIHVALLFLVDAAGTGKPVLNSVGAFSTFGILLSVVITALFVIGLVERRDRTLFRMGIDSVAVLVVYVAGLVLLYTLRDVS